MPVWMKLYQETILATWSIIAHPLIVYYRPTVNVVRKIVLMVILMPHVNILVLMPHILVVKDQLVIAKSMSGIK